MLKLSGASRPALRCRGAALKQEICNVTELLHTKATQLWGKICLVNKVGVNRSYQAPGSRPMP